MRRAEEEGVRRLLGLGWRLLRSGQAREAADAFGRVLLRRPDQTEARRGVTRARQAAAEQERLIEMESVSRSHRPSGTQAMPGLRSSPALKRAQRTRGDVGVPAGRAASRSRPGGPRRLVWGRRVLLASSGAAVALVLVMAHLRWGVFMSELCRPPTPSPSAGAPVLALPLPSAGQRTLVEAHHKIDSGDAPAAQLLLQSIAPEDPAYPFAQRMKLELPGHGERP